MSKVDHSRGIPTTKLVISMLGVSAVWCVNSMFIEELHAPVLWIK
jgi:hypothetical protein